MQQLDREIVENLLRSRWATLACTNADGTALASQVAIAWVPGTSALVMHLSTLAKHTRNLLERPHAALSISELDDAREDPQTLARISIDGTVAVVARESIDYQATQRRYLERLPLAAPRFDFGDFNLFSLTVNSAQYVGGFARAFRISPHELSQISTTGHE